MSVYNRKMFNRNARNKLNQSAGVPSFANGGSTSGVLQTRGFPGAILSSDPIYRGRATRGLGTTLDGRTFTFPTTANTLSGASDIGIARKALEGGLGALSTPEAMSIGASSSGFKARRGAENRFGQGAGIATLADIAGQITGGLGGGAVQGLLTADEPDENTMGGRLAGLTPNEDYLKNLGFNIMDFTNRASSQGGPTADEIKAYQDQLQEQQYQASVDAADRDAGAVLPTMPTDPFASDEEIEVREREEDAVRALMAENGQVTFDPESGTYKGGAPTEAMEEELKKKTDKAFTNTPDLDVTEDEANDAAASVDISPPAPRPENFEQIVAAAKKTTPDVPDNISPQDAVDIAREKGTGSIEDLKSEFLALLPKYEEDKSTMGLNLAMMGFAIAGGESENALTNIANGMKQTLPALIKSKEKKKAFQRETELLAAKYAIARTEDDRKQDRLKNTYFVTEAFTDPTTGQEYEAGQMVRLNDKAFEIAERSGLTKNLTTSAIMQKRIEADIKAAEGMGYKEVNALYDRVSREFGGYKYEVMVPTAYGRSKGVTTQMLANDQDLPAITSEYVNKLDKIHQLDKGVGEALALVSTGEATGGKAIIGRLFDGIKGAGGSKALELVGFSEKDINKLSTAGQYERLHGVLAMQLAPILLGEAGKTISDADRVRVAQALGYEAQLVNGNAIINLTGGAPKLFQSEADARQSLTLIQNVLRNRAKETHGEYRTFATGLGLQFAERQADKNTQSALTAGSGFNMVLGEDGIYDLTAVE